MKGIDLTGIKNEALIIKGEIKVSDMPENQKADLLLHMEGLLAFINMEINIQNALRNEAFDLANRI